MSKANSRPWYVVAKKLGKERKITQQAIADALGVSKGAVSLWYSGTNRPRLETIQRIAQMLGSTVTELIAEDPYFITEEEERQLIDLFRQLPPEKQQEAKEYLAFKLNLTQEKQ